MPERLRNLVLQRAHNCCEYCFSQADYSPAPFGIEHIFPTAKGGASEPENLAWSCQGCNGRKHTFTDAPDPYTGFLAPLFNPRTDKWEEHFAWDEEFSQIIGLSPIGRATVECLDLNRKEVFNLRKLLVPLGLHPPR
ncbi:MAG: HNH endonuclease [Phycisphaerae bacterium]|nr:HNH endonuclease [Saprospiraceae bacterium]